MENLDANERILTFYKNIRIEFDRAFRDEIAKTGLTRSQFSVLVSIRQAQNKPASVGDIGKETFMSPGNCSSMCKKLETMGLIRRERSQTDERQVFLYLTEKGREQTDNLKSIVKNVNSRALEKISAKEYEKLINAFDTVENFLTQISSAAVEMDE